MIRVNLLPIKALQAEVTRRREVIIGSSVLGSLAALLIGAHMYQARELSHLQNELSGLRSELQSLNLKVKEVGDLQNKIKDFRSKNKIIEDLNRKKSGPVLVMLIEKDEAEVRSGIRWGETIGAPVALGIENRDWKNWTKKMSALPEDRDDKIAVTKPRPGHVGEVDL